MQLTGQQIAKFQRIWREKFGYSISRQEAIDKGSKLVRLLKTVYRPNPLHNAEHQKKVSKYSK